MRKLLMLAALGLMLAGCGGTTDEAHKTAELVKKYCGIAVNVGDITAAFSAPNAAITGAVAMARAICAQAQASGETGALDNCTFEDDTNVIPEGCIYQVQSSEESKPDCVAIVNGVCIRKEN